MITIQQNALVIIDPRNLQEDVEIYLDETIYPKAYDLIMAIKEMDFTKPEKAVYDVIRLRKILWHLGAFLKEKLNTMSNRDPDYGMVEYEFKDIMNASSLVVAMIEMMESGYNIFQNSVANPYFQAELN